METIMTYNFRVSYIYKDITIDGLNGKFLDYGTRYKSKKKKLRSYGRHYFLSRVEHD